MDRLRREDAELRRLPLVVTGPEPAGDDWAGGDERLRMLFACCHPALPADARAAMMLRFVAGLTTAEIARLFLVPEATMAARLTRAKAKMARLADQDRGRRHHDEIGRCARGGAEPARRAGRGAAGQPPRARDPGGVAAAVGAAGRGGDGWSVPRSNASICDVGRGGAPGAYGKGVLISGLTGRM